MSDRTPEEYTRRGDPEGTVAMFGCVTCGALYTVDSRRHMGDRREIQARQDAKDCMFCRTETLDPDECARQDREAREARERRIARAKVATDLAECFSDTGNMFYRDTLDAEEAGETGVFGARFVPYRIDFGTLLEGVVEGSHDDASVDELDDVDALADAVDQFNKAQTKGWYEMDDTQWQSLPQRRTFAMIKPDATARAVENDMITDIEAAGFRVIDKRRVLMTQDQAEWLYREHSKRDHFADLVAYTVSGEVVMMLIEGDDDNVPAAFRKLMGATDHTKAEPGTLRARYAIGYRENSIHGSDSPKAAVDEIIHFMR